MRLIKAIALASAALCACAAVLLAASAGATAATKRPRLSYDPATQSHPGACSQNTLNVPHAVGDLSANGILGQYAVLVGVHATGSALRTEMSQTLVVLRVAGTAITVNHGCTTDGIIFPVGSRTLTAGETVGVGLPASIRAKLCNGPAVGCQRKVLTEHTVFPTNCWNLDQGSVPVVVYLHKPQAKPKPKPKPTPPPKTKAKSILLRPSASVTTACGVGNAGASTVTLKNGASATGPATFIVNGKTYGPLRPGKTQAVTVALQTGASTDIKVSSGGQVLVNQSDPADPCATTPPAPPAPPAPTAAPPTPTAAPSAKATSSCSTGIVVTLANAASATASATFTLNGTSYGPLGPGATETVSIPVTPGTTQQVTVTSGGQTVLNAYSYTNSCVAGPSALASAYCVPSNGEPFDYPGTGTIALELSDGASAGAPASFTVTATGNTTSGFGPTTLGPVVIGATLTELIPIDASGNPITLTVSSGGTQLISEPFAGCAESVEAE